VIAVAALNHSVIVRVIGPAMRKPPHRRLPWGRLYLAALPLIGACVAPPGPGPGAPVAALSDATAPRSGARELVITADPRASAAGLAMLRRGGAPIDAAVAAQAVLGLVEPQESGFGGGAVLLSWRAADGRLSVIDGLPRAGHAAARGVNEDGRGRSLDPAAGLFGGGAVGVPGVLPALWRAHQKSGKLPWADLFAPAIAFADSGFTISRGLREVLAAPGARASYGEAAAPFLMPDGSAPPVGAVLRAPAYAATLRRVARLGPAGLYDGAALTETLVALRGGPRPSRLTAADLAAYAPTEPAPLRMEWRGWTICSAPPPSFGGLVASQMLAIAGAGDILRPGFAHRFLDAGRLAEMDRRRFVADPAFLPVPTAGLLDQRYLAARAALIPNGDALMHPRPGAPPTSSAAADDPGAPTTATSQIVVVARNGDALTMTSSLTHVFGARVAVGGVVFNNALANFAPAPPSGVRYANGMEPNKRPATPFAPVIVLDPAGKPLLLGGGGGGPFVPDLVAAALIDMLANNRSPAEALARPHISSADPDHVAVEAGTAAEALLPALKAMGYRARADRLASASAFALRGPTGWLGAADPRRDGVALGD
jgi:gamma-glutamyltranspeptidase/glutathione hydrolase